MDTAKERIEEDIMEIEGEVEETDAKI